MNTIAIQRPHFHWSWRFSKELMWSALLAALVIAATLVAWWFAGQSAGTESVLFNEVNGAA